MVCTGFSVVEQDKSHESMNTDAKRGKSSFMLLTLSIK